MPGKYQKPVCDCGEELVYINNQFKQTRRRVTKDGKISKNILGTHYNSTDDPEYLCCLECGKTYNYLYDDEYRIVRGGELL
ncbi:hypothetical protein KHQ81_15855 (plasmid) [Mycoplasmatota bacterium]|nr:hypothetical protein KHQ81_15855 [Mycoplasmatota bacterium]